jgi:hypothetical protein
MIAESKTAGYGAAACGCKSKRTNGIVAKFHSREARSEQKIEMSWWLPFFVPPFLILDDSARILSEGLIRVNRNSDMKSDIKKKAFHPGKASAWCGSSPGVAPALSGIFGMAPCDTPRRRPSLGGKG